MEGQAMNADQLIDFVARTESNGQYDRWNPNDNGAGVSLGLIQFNQRRGSLPDLLQAMYRADSKKFAELAAPFSMLFLSPTWVRKADLNDKAFKTPILNLLRHEPFHAVQRALARKQYLEPSWKAARAKGLYSERAAAICFDTSVQHGLGFLNDALKGTTRYLLEKSALEDIAEAADRGLGEERGRRHAILNDPSFSDERWDIKAGNLLPPPEHQPVTFNTNLKRGSWGSDVGELRRILRHLGFMAPTSHGTQFGPKTEQAVKAFQKAKGLEVDGIVGPLTRAELSK
jgi:hypothetical protein